LKSAIALAVTCLAASAMAQSNDFDYDLRIVEINGAVGNGGDVLLPAAGGVVSFWLQGRTTANSLAPNRSNFGIGRISAGPTGQTPAFIRVTDSVAETRLGRGSIGASGTGANAGVPLTGRGPLFRTGGTSDSVVSPWHSATQNGTGGRPFPSGTGNEMGVFDQDGDRLHGFDCYGGFQRFGADNAFVAAGFTPNSLGETSVWYNLYRFDVLVSGNTGRSVTLNAAGYVAAFVAFREISAGVWVSNVTGPAAGSESAIAPAFTFNVIPSPGAAALMGLGALAAGRRRR
jgi:hypothetical protein